jgi:hypothetical protein
MRYTPAVNAKKALIGCGSPKARGAEPHPARFAAFLFRTRLGGSNGEAQASPVTLRVPRSSTPVRAAAQCGSWSAVVHQAQLEINMADSTSDFTQIQRNRFDPRPCDLAALPFVGDVKIGPRKTARSFWLTPNIECYGTGNIVGAQYAADYLQYTRQNPFWVGSGTLGHIAKAMYSAENIQRAHGIPVGFWSLIERVLYQATAHVDAYAIAEASAEKMRGFLKDQS